MTDISDFPPSLRPIIEQGFLDREFQHAIKSQAKYRLCAERITDGAGIGETIANDRYSATMNIYAATVDFHVITDRVGIASQFLQNAYVNGEQAARSLDSLACSALFDAYAAFPLRPSGDKVRLGDTLRMGLLLDAAAHLRKSGAPEIDGAYNCYVDPVSARQLFADPDFRALFQGATSANQVFKSGMTNDFLGLRFIPVSDNRCLMREGLVIRRPVICGAGALVELGYKDALADDVRPHDALVTLIDGVAMVTRRAFDRLTKVVAQSWYWIGAFAAPTDDGEHRRAVVLEHVG